MIILIAYLYWQKYFYFIKAPLHSWLKRCLKKLTFISIWKDDRDDHTSNCALKIGTLLDALLLLKITAKYSNTFILNIFRIPNNNKDCADFLLRLSQNFLNCKRDPSDILGVFLRRSLSQRKLEERHPCYFRATRPFF